MAQTTIPTKTKLTPNQYEALKRAEYQIANRLVKGYRSNIRLKRAGEPIEWTAEMLMEFKRCSKDPVYFAENYIKIIGETEDESGLMQLLLYDYQQEMIKAMHENRRSIFCTARQVGKSTIVCAYILWFVLFNPDKTVAILANKGDTAREIFARIRLAYQYLPKWLQQGIVDGGWNKGSLELENNSRIITSSSSSDAIRGYSIDFLFVDEAAFVEHWDDFASAVLNTVTNKKHHKVCFVSTPNGLNHFHDYWKSAEKKSNGYVPIKVTWNMVPGRDEEWKKETLAMMNHDHQKFAREQEVAFLGSSGTLIAGWKLEMMNSNMAEPLHDNGFLKQYEEPRKNHVYIICADVSRGKGLDYSAFSVIDVTKVPHKQVAVFKSNVINVPDYAGIIDHVGRLYNNAWVLVEINDIGEEVPRTLFENFEYENIIHTQSRGGRGKKVSSGSGSNIDKGMRTTRTTKSTGCSMLKMLIEQDKLLIGDKDTVMELNVFSAKGQSYEAESGKNDDLVMGLVIFAWLTMDPFFQGITDESMMMALREQTEDQMMSELTPFGAITRGHDEEVYENLEEEGWEVVDTWL